MLQHLVEREKSRPSMIRARSGAGFDGYGRLSVDSGDSRDAAWRGYHAGLGWRSGRAEGAETRRRGSGGGPGVA